MFGDYKRCLEAPQLGNKVNQLEKNKLVLEKIIKNLNHNNLITVCYYHVTDEFQSESTLYSMPECQITPCLKQAPYLKFK